jgi:type III secretory pathway component EscS
MRNAMLWLVLILTLPALLVVVVLGLVLLVVRTAWALSEAIAEEIGDRLEDL